MLQKLAFAILKVSGWELRGQVPELQKAVFIAAPHTSNWDGFWLLVAKCGWRVDVRFLAKNTLFWWPLGSVLQAFGAIPIDRSKTSSTVDLVVQKFAEEDKLFFALAPEGTRRRMPYWKTGFYQIAQTANVPIVLAYIDYRQKCMGIGIMLQPGGDEKEDLQKIRDFYKPFAGRRPERASPVVFPSD